MSRCPTQDPTHADCTVCDGEVKVGRFEPIRVERTDADGFPVYDTSTGEVLYVLVPLPVHVEPTTHSVFNPGNPVQYGRQR